MMRPTTAALSERGYIFVRVRRFASLTVGHASLVSTLWIAYGEGSHSLSIAYVRAG